jgi:hypothetical protein
VSIDPRNGLVSSAALAGHPTPNTPNGGRTMADTMSMDATGKTADGVKHTASLEHCAKLAGHPTPNCPTGGANSQRENRNAGGADLEEMANLAGHPSPRAEDSEQTGAHRGEPDTLNSCSKLAGHHTPAVRDLRNSSGDGTNPRDNPRMQALALGATTESTATSTAKTAGYRLNPGFSLWLMIGIPTIVDAWASCGVRAMQSCRRARRSS